MAEILIVCTANICRSPVGEALLRDRLQKKGLSDWTVKSAGTWAQSKRSASTYSVEIMTEQGFDIIDHRAEMIKLSHMKKADLILCMEAGHKEALQAEFPPYAKKVYLLSEMIDRNYSISDPYGKSKDSYYRMVNDLTTILDNGLDAIIVEAEANAAKT